jgi:very-short-patch-repair endonuclease
MGYYDAVRDHIPMRKDKNGNTGFYPPCKICGEPVYSWNYVSGTDYTCPKCREELVKQYREEHEESGKDKKFNAAVKRISKVADTEKYKSAIAAVQKCLMHRGWFQSTEEIMTAIELIHRGYKVYPQVKVFDYRVDFVIPELKTALEIDGEVFHQKKDKEQSAMRDELISDKLDGYHVIHIPAENINMNITKLVPAIKAVIRNREKNTP